MSERPLSAGLDGQWDDLVVLCATTPWGGHGIGDQAVGESLTRYAPLLYVDPPVSPLTAWRDPHRSAASDEPLLRRVDERVLRLTPRVPPAMERPIGKALADWSTRRALERTVRGLGQPRVRAVIVPSYNPMFGVCGEERRVFWAKDDFLAGAELMRISAPRLRRAERAQLRRADLVVAASEVLAQRFSGPDHETILMANGCDPTLGAAVDRACIAGDVRLEAPLAIVVGCLNDRLDLRVLAAVADAGVSLLFVGPCSPSWRRRALDPLLARPNVQWVGSRAPDELPAYLAAAAVGLVPYQDTAFNRASFPLKMLEYLSAGLPVVATDLPAVRWLDTDLVDIQSDPAAFARAVVSTAHEVPSPAAIRRRRRFAARHGWDERVDRLAAALDLAPPVPAVAAWDGAVEVAR